MQHSIKYMPVYRPSLFDVRAKSSVYLAYRDFDLWVFGGAFKIAVAVDPSFV